jgi:hypothetical protein
MLYHILVEAYISFQAIILRSTKQVELIVEDASRLEELVMGRAYP